MAVPPDRLPGTRLLDRLLDREARRASKRDFMLRMLPPGSEAAEIGVFDGAFSERILSLVRPRRLHLVDPWTPKQDGTFYDGDYRGVAAGDAAARTLEDQFQTVQRRLQPDIDAGTVVMHRMLSFDAAPLFAPESLDWVYVDASHYYDDVKRDLADWLPKVKRGGIFCGDDYGRKSFWNHGVTRAVDELIAGGTVERLAIRNHQFVLRRR
jgi:hypothetical protein